MFILRTFVFYVKSGNPIVYTIGFLDFTYFTQSPFFLKINPLIINNNV